MQKITPHLWFDTQAKEAAEFYVAAFGNGSRILDVSVLHDTPSGSVDIVSFELAGQSFMGISAGPLFKFNPSVSFHVKCRTKEEVDAIWQVLSDGGAALVPLGTYPWSERYGWLRDRYGLSWQIIYTGSSQISQRVTPVMMFVGKVCGKAEEAIKFYHSVFRNAKVDNLLRYGKGEDPDKEGTLKYGAFTLEGQEFGAMDSAQPHDFAFNEAISLMVYCRTQDEIDYYWNRLSAVPQAEQCGWLKDKFGLSWQVVPTDMDEMLQRGSKEQIARVTQAFLKMKKFDLMTLRRAYEGTDRAD
jgi:predicted 3-demethylubiquinone-9 3-methyltransferase (glyoxalase superfamily)